jgi:uncharacterized membrane protein
MNLRVAILLALFAFPFAAAQADILPPSIGPSANELTLSISLQNGPVAQDTFLQVNYKTAEGSDYETMLVVKEKGEATLYSSSEISSISLLYDDPATPAPDGLWNGKVDGKSATPILIKLQPIADIAGILTDSDGMPASNAVVELTCPDGANMNATTSSSGAFSFTHARAGECLIAAQANGQAIAENLNLSAGEFKRLDLQLKKPFPVGTLLLAGAVIAILLIGIWLTFRKHKHSPVTASHLSKKPKNKAKPEQQHSIPTQRQADLIATLNDKEKLIMEFVMKQAPSAVRVSKIRRELLIPKTSLTRTLQALERKQFLQLKKDGSRLCVQLHDFFRKN